MKRTKMPSWLTDLVDRQEHDTRLDRIGEAIAGAAAPLGEGALGSALRGEPMGHRAHPMMTDLPIGFFTSSFVVDLVGGSAGRKVSQRLVGLGLLSAIPTAMTGAVDYHDAASDPRIRRVGAVHGIGNVAVLFLYFRSWRSRRHGHHLRGVIWGALGGAAASMTGYLGGHMAFARGANVEDTDDPIVDLTLYEDVDRSVETDGRGFVPVTGEPADDDGVGSGSLSGT